MPKKKKKDSIPSWLLEGFTQVPNFVLHTTELDAMAKLLYAVLLSHAFLNEDGERKDLVYASNTKLAEKLGLSASSHKTIKRAKAALEEVGLIEEVRRGMGKPNAFRLLDPSKSGLLDPIKSGFHNPIKNGLTNPIKNGLHDPTKNKKQDKKKKFGKKKKCVSGAGAPNGDTHTPSLHETKTGKSKGKSTAHAVPKGKSHDKAKDKASSGVQNASLDFDALLSCYPMPLWVGKKQAEAIWKDLGDGYRESAVKGAKSLSYWFVRAESSQRKFFPSIRTFLEDEQWLHTDAFWKDRANVGVNANP